jgi:hypothetical protein
MFMGAGLPRSHRAELPRRDDEARARLEVVGGQARPVTLAHERTFPVPGELGALLPDGALIRGSTVAVDGAAGAGATSLVFELAAAVTAVGEWVAVVDLEETIGAEAAGAAGVALERFAVIRQVPPDRWAMVVAALLDGMSLVITEVPRYARAGDVRRLVARARERGVVLIVSHCMPSIPIALRMTALGGSWSGLTQGGGLLSDRIRRVKVEAHGASVVSA